MPRQRAIHRKRAADWLQVALSNLLHTRVADPRLELLTITEIRVDRELEFANIWVCAANADDHRRDEVLQALVHARGFIRRELASSLQLRRIPQLIFHWDFAPDRAARIETLIDSWQQSDVPSTRTGNSDEPTT